MSIICLPIAKVMVVIAAFWEWRRWAHYGLKKGALLNACICGLLIGEAWNEELLANVYPHSWFKVHLWNCPYALCNSPVLLPPCPLMPPPPHQLPAPITDLLGLLGSGGEAAVAAELAKWPPLVCCLHHNAWWPESCCGPMTHREQWGGSWKAEVWEPLCYTGQIFRLHWIVAQLYLFEVLAQCEITIKCCVMAWEEATPVRWLCQPVSSESETLGWHRRSEFHAEQCMVWERVVRRHFRGGEETFLGRGQIRPGRCGIGRGGILTLLWDQPALHWACLKSEKLYMAAWSVLHPA